MRRQRLQLETLLRLHRLGAPSGIRRLQTIAVAVQPIVISLAVIIGGAWTWYTFRAGLYVENAQAQLQKLTREIEAEPRLEIDINTVQLDVPGSGDRHVLGTITIKNVGSGNTLLAFQDAPVRIYRVRVGGAGEIWVPIRSLDLRGGPGAKIGFLMCQTNATRHADFIATVDDAGLYVATFAANRNPLEKKAMTSLGAVVSGREGRIEWKAVHYFTLR